MTLDQRTTFITGVYGSGKTTLAMRFVAEAMGAAARVSEQASTSEERNAARCLIRTYRCYDSAHDYQDKDFDVRGYLESLTHEDVIDAIPFNENEGWRPFLKFYNPASHMVVVTFCEKLRWLDRIGTRGEKAELDFRDFYLRAFGLLDQHGTHWFDSGPTRTFVNRAVAARILGLKGLLRSYLGAPPKGHDARYQDVPEVDFKGYSESAKSWERIHPLTTWEKRDVVDAGCFHGFFSFRSLEAGAMFVQGLDRSRPALMIAGCVQSLRPGWDRVVFREWSAGERIPGSDLLLCLNALHHFPDKKAFIDEALTRFEECIFEINKEDKALLRNIDKVVKSHRENRLIVRCLK